MDGVSISTSNRGGLGGFLGGLSGPGLGGSGGAAHMENGTFKI